jgi:hypothetical protein
MIENVPDGRDPFVPGEGGLNFEKATIELQPVGFDVSNDDECDQFLADTLGIDKTDVHKVKDYASAVVNLNENTAAVIVYRPAVVDYVKAGTETL